MRAAPDSPLAVIRLARPDLAGARILDIGCGSGELARQLTAEGARVTGIDPLPQALVAARKRAPGAVFVAAQAEALPFADASFDIALLVNALHHVPAGSMDAALTEAARLVGPGGCVIVIEPLAEGSFFQAVRLVEDETAVRAAAQAALARALAGGTLEVQEGHAYVRREAFGGAGELLARIVAVEPRREATVWAMRETLMAAVLAAGERLPDGRLGFDQPMKAEILRVRTARRGPRIGT